MKFNTKLQASTLVEALISMIIVMMVFVIGSMIYVNVINSDNGRQKLNAELLLQQVTVTTKRENKFLDEKIEAGNIIIQKKVVLYKNISNLHLLLLIAFDKQGKQIADHQELISF